MTPPDAPPPPAAQLARSGPGASRGPTVSVAGTGLALLLLAAGSYGLSFVRLGAWALPLALLIAAAKASLVVLVFMELRREAASVKLASLAAILLFLLLVTLTAADVATRVTPTLVPSPAVAPQ